LNVNSNAFLPAGGGMPPVAPGTSNIFGVNQGLSADRRYGWIGFYRRDYVQTTVAPIVNIPAPYAQVWIITAQSTTDGQQFYGDAPLITAANFFPDPPAIPATPGATVTGGPNANVQVGLTYAQGASTITFTGYTGTGPVRDGAFVLITGLAKNSLKLPNGDASNQTAANQIVGWYSKLGTPAPGTVAAQQTYVWYLQSDPPPTIINSNGLIVPLNAATTNNNYKFNVFVLGSPVSPDNTTNPPTYLGPPQDITCTTGFVRINN
jgi:hypothetical protein